MFQDKIALVTGASRGIGEGIALALGRAGATIIGTATTEKGAQKITAYCRSNHFRGKGFVLDVTQPDSITALMAAIKAEFGSVNILINNAAITEDNLFLRMKDEEWLKVIDTDLTGIFRLSRACLRDMLKAREGRIINIGSVVGSTGNPGQVNYCAAKAGLTGFSKALAQEVGSRHITVNVIAPGFITTDMTESMSDEQRAAIFNRIPMQRPGTVEDIAALVVFLASPSGNYITGQTLHVNGGMYMN